MKIHDEAAARESPAGPTSRPLIRIAVPAILVRCRHLADAGKDAADKPPKQGYSKRARAFKAALRRHLRGDSDVLAEITPGDRP